MSTCPNPYQEVEVAFFAPQTASGEIKDFDSTFDPFKDDERVGCVNYDNNLLDQIEARQKKGLLPQFGPDVLIDWDKIQASNKAQGFEDFYGGIEGGTRLTYQGEWFSEETEPVVPRFTRYVVRRMVEDEDGFLTESDIGGLYRESTLDERLTEYFKAVGSCNSQNDIEPAGPYLTQEEKEAAIAKWLKMNGDERKLLFFNYLDYLQDEARRQKKGAAPVYLEVEGGDWQMMDTGMGKKIHCRWRLERGGVKIGIHSDPKGTIPAIDVEFGYQAVKCRTFLEVVAEVEAVLKAMGFNIKSQKISRIDLQLTVDLPFSVVARSFSEKRFVSRVTKWAVYQGKICRMDTDQEIQTPIQSIIGGSGKTIIVRLYDKIKECFKSPENLEKLNDLYSIMGIREHLTRVEFQLCREWLNEHRINTVDDFYANLPEILHYLTSSYFRVLENAKTSHAERQQTARWWDDVQSKFMLAFNANYEGKALQRIESKVYSPDALIKQALGCFKAAFSNLEGEKPMEQNEFYAAVFRTVRQYLPQLYDDYVKLWKTNKIQREPLTSLKAEYDYSKIVQKRYDLMIDDEEEEGEGD